MHSPQTRLAQLAPPAVEPLSVPDAQAFLQVSNDADLIGQMIAAAREDLEHRTQRSWIAQRWELAMDFLPVALNFAPYSYLDPWPRAIELPRPPLVSVDTIAYRDQSGVETVLPPSSYVVSPGTPGRVAPAFGSVFPFCYPQISCVSIQYTAGFGPSAASVPANLILALKHLVAHMYDNRSEDAAEPRLIERLIRRWKWDTYA